MQLQLDTVCSVRKPKKKKVITVSLKLLELELNIKTEQKVIYIDNIMPNHSLSSGL